MKASQVVDFLAYAHCTKRISPPISSNKMIAGKKSAVSSNSLLPFKNTMMK